MSYTTIRKVCWVDLPNPDRTNDDDAWVNMDMFFSRQEALEYLEENWGIHEEDAGVFITEGEI